MIQKKFWERELKTKYWPSSLVQQLTLHTLLGWKFITLKKGPKMKQHIFRIYEIFSQNSCLKWQEKLVIFQSEVEALGKKCEQKQIWIHFCYTGKSVFITIDNFSLRNSLLLSSSFSISQFWDRKTLIFGHL